jgi:hypothetical protein
MQLDTFVRTPAALFVFLLLICITPPHSLHSDREDCVSTSCKYNRCTRSQISLFGFEQLCMWCRKLMSTEQNFFSRFVPFVSQCKTGWSAWQYKVRIAECAKKAFTYSIPSGSRPATRLRAAMLQIAATVSNRETIRLYF